MNNEERLCVGLIFGGRGREREVSIKGKSYLLPLIDRDKYSVTEIFIDHKGRWLKGEEEVYPKNGGLANQNGSFHRIDCAFPLLHGDFGEDGVVQGALECMDIPYVGCDVSAGAVCRDKSYVKIIADSLGIPTLPHLSLIRHEGVDFALRRVEEKLGYPVFIKPARLGSSIGASMANDRGALYSALKLAFSLCDKAIAEPYLEVKRELECGYFSTKCKEIFTYPGEILLNGVYGYEEKYLSGDTRLAIRADVASAVSQRIREYSRRLVRALGIRQLCRVDYFLSGEELYFNEINTMPGFTEGSLYPKMIEAAGFCPTELVNLLIEDCLAR